MHNKILNSMDQQNNDNNNSISDQNEVNIDRQITNSCNYTQETDKTEEAEVITPQVYHYPLFHDNYTYLIRNKNIGILIDPSHFEPIRAYLEYKHKSITITHILLTHKHADHTKEVSQVLNYYNKKYKKLSKKNHKIEVIMGKEDAIDGLATRLVGSDSISEFQVENINVKIIPAPCHTRGSLMFHITGSGQKSLELEEGEGAILFHNQTSAQDGKRISALFTGDTLFQGGCGKFFEGTAAEMLRNIDFISNLSDDTYIFCGHEYTAQNLKWASNVDFDNKAIYKRYKEIIDQSLYVTVPSTVGYEKQTNVFMRIRNSKLCAKLNVKNQSDPEQVLLKLRDMKDKDVTCI